MSVGVMFCVSNKSAILEKSRLGFIEIYRDSNKKYLFIYEDKKRRFVVSRDGEKILSCLSITLIKDILSEVDELQFSYVILGRNESEFEACEKFRKAKSVKMLQISINIAENIVYNVRSGDLEG